MFRRPANRRSEGRASRCGWPRLCRSPRLATSTRDGNISHSRPPHPIAPPHLMELPFSGTPARSRATPWTRRAPRAPDRQRPIVSSRSRTCWLDTKCEGRDDHRGGDRHGLRIPPRSQQRHRLAGSGGAVVFYAHERLGAGSRRACSQHALAELLGVEGRRFLPTHTGMGFPRRAFL